MFPDAPNTGLVEVTFLADRGADRSLLSPRDAIQAGRNFAALAAGQASRGVGGETSTLLVGSEIFFQGYTIPLTPSIPESQRPIPTVLGRDFMRDFALFMEEFSGRVLFLDQADVETYGLAAVGKPVILPSPLISPPQN
jgi:hypothetical protein